MNQHDFAALGLSPHQSSTQNSLFNSKNVFGLFTLILAFILSSAYIFYEANTFLEYTVSSYVSSSYLLAIVIFTIFIWKSRMLFKFMHDVEKIVNKSKYYVSVKYLLLIVYYKWIRIHFRA